MNETFKQEKKDVSSPLASWLSLDQAVAFATENYSSQQELSSQNKTLHIHLKGRLYYIVIVREILALTRSYNKMKNDSG